MRLTEGGSNLSVVKPDIEFEERPETETFRLTLIGFGLRLRLG